MATFTKRGDKWRVEVRSKKSRRSKTFSSKAKAKAWANQIELDFEDEVLGKIPNKSFGDLLERYSRLVTPLKRGHVREHRAIDRILQDKLADIPLIELAGRHFADWRDRRLKDVCGSTVNREMNILSHACNTARKEWGWLKSTPTSDIKRPKESPPRTRRPTQEETDRLMHVMGYDKVARLDSKSSRVGAAYLFAIETAMRAGEIVGITKEYVLEKHVHIPKSKTDLARNVPLSTEARRLINQVMEATDDMDTVFGLTSTSIDALFRKYKKRAGVTGLHFHDTRREALTRLSLKFGVMELAKISGHKDLSILLNVYYTPSVDELANKMD